MLPSKCQQGLTSLISLLLLAFSQFAANVRAQEVTEQPTATPPSLNRLPAVDLGTMTATKPTTSSVIKTSLPPIGSEIPSRPLIGPGYKIVELPELARVISVTMIPSLPSVPGFKGFSPLLIQQKGREQVGAYADKLVGEVLTRPGVISAFSVVRCLNNATQEIDPANHTVKVTIHYDTHIYVVVPNTPPPTLRLIPKPLPPRQGQKPIITSSITIDSSPSKGWIFLNLDAEK